MNVEDLHRAVLAVLEEDAYEGYVRVTSKVLTDDERQIFRRGFLAGVGADISHGNKDVWYRAGRLVGSADAAKKKNRLPPVPLPPIKEQSK